jgi:hypothetical protein
MCLSVCMAALQGPTASMRGVGAAWSFYWIVVLVLMVSQPSTSSGLRGSGPM